MFQDRECVVLSEIEFLLKNVCQWIQPLGFCGDQLLENIAMQV